ncbi:pentatricopeptide repeat-containing protein, mitochondrial [Cocos nucifera]|nr:pentatricopeptide repeat-containing protein, mitochondrial [Cocos nucifera]
MATLARVRHRLLSFPIPHLLLHRLSSAAAILSPGDPSAVLTSKQKSRAALSLLKSEKNPARIVEICRAADLTPASPLDRTALSIAASKLAASGSFAALRSYLDGFLTPRPDISSDRLRSHAIVLFGQAGMFDDAVRTFKTSDSPSVRSLNALLFACILAKKHDEVGRIFRDFPTSYGIAPNLDTYNTVIKSFCESGTSRSFFSVLDEMIRVGIKPNMTTFCTALAGFYREERFDDVGKVLELMKKHDCHPGLSAYNVRLQSLCKLKRLGEAKALFEEMLAKGMKPNWVTYNHLIFGFCKEGDLEEAKKLYKEMGRRGCVADSSCYFTLIYYLCQGGDFEAALGVAKETMARNWVPCFSTMKMLVNGLVSRSKVEEARELIEKMKEKFSGNADMWKEVEEGLPQ